MARGKKTSKLKITSLFILGVVFLLAVLATGSFFYFSHQPNLDKAVINVLQADKSFGWKFPVAKFPTAGPGGLIAFSTIRDPGGVPQGLPVRLKIPVIGVDSAIEDALITPDGRMDVPAGSVNVAWFALGPHPGKEGSAVIGGHFGIENGKPFVFYKLDQVQVGAKIYIDNDSGETLAFQVQRIQSFDRNADATTVFTSGDGKSHLNLITCEGTWNQVNGSYPLRLVVFADAIPSEGAVVIKTPATVAAKPNLPQTAVTPAKATPAAKPTAAPTQAPTIPPASTPPVGNTAPIGEQNPLASPQILIASARSLYATPTDGLITSILLISIVFVAFRIIRR